MRLFVASGVFVLLALSVPGIVSKLEDNITQCGDFFFDEKPPVIPGILEDSVAQNNHYKIICQKYKNKIRFATLYDTTNKIPVFSAYKYTGTTEFRRPQMPWMIEPQLDPSGGEMHEPFVKQTRNQDYWIDHSDTCTPDALFSVNHTADRETAESTFTLTNSVPQKKGFRDGIWNFVENETKKYMDSNCTDHQNNTVAYVLTGAVPGNGKVNKRVNIPSHVWMAFCCYNSTSWNTWSYKAENKRHNAVTTIRLKSLEELQNFLTEKFKKNITLFNNNCG
ncbi:endonuclease domain-containing 1 protein-like [Paramisgurnus dabryanus]|uniref:endonuclease domain-containing 1 protein-like n=1 Tax=Paramisgurnus dabryanus TaxID=90735 RepID=UPI0031F38EBD